MHIRFPWTSDQLVSKAATYTTYHKHKKQTLMLSVWFEPAIPAIKSPPNFALVRTVTGIGLLYFVTLIMLGAKYQSWISICVHPVTYCLLVINVFLSTMIAGTTFGRWPNDAQFFYIIRLFQSSTRFEQTRAHHQEVICINTAACIVILCKWPSGMQFEKEFLLDLHAGRSLTESDYTRCRINTTDLLMMSTCFLETCRGLK